MSPDCNVYKVFPPRPRVTAALLSRMGRAFQLQADVGQVNCVQNLGSALGIGFHSGIILSFDRSCRKRDNGLLVLRRSSLNVWSGIRPCQFVIACGKLRRSYLHSRRDGHGLGFLAAKSGTATIASINTKPKKRFICISSSASRIFPSHKASRKLHCGALWSARHLLCQLQ